MITNSGGGYSRWNDFDLTRWRSDTTLRSLGQFHLPARSDDRTKLWSASHKPFAPREGESDVRFSADRTELRRRDLRNRNGARGNGRLRRRCRTAPPESGQSIFAHASNRAHQLRGTRRWRRMARTKRIPHSPRCSSRPKRPEPGVLLAHRRQRSPEDPPIWMGHALVSPAGSAAGGIEAETDRAKFLGRGNSPANPAALARQTQWLDRHRDRPHLQPAPAE